MVINSAYAGDLVPVPRNNNGGSGGGNAKSEGYSVPSDGREIVVSRSSEEEIKKRRPIIIDGEYTVISSKLQKKSQIGKTLINTALDFPIEITQFYAAMGLLAFYQCTSGFTASPMACLDFMASTTDPVGLVSFFAFSLTMRMMNHAAGRPSLNSSLWNMILDEVNPYKKLRPGVDFKIPTVNAPLALPNPNSPAAAPTSTSRALVVAGPRMTGNAAEMWKMPDLFNRRAVAEFFWGSFTLGTGFIVATVLAEMMMDPNIRLATSLMFKKRDSKEEALYKKALENMGEQWFSTKGMDRLSPMVVAILGSSTVAHVLRSAVGSILLDKNASQLASQVAGKNKIVLKPMYVKMPIANRAAALWETRFISGLGGFIVFLAVDHYVVRPYVEREWDELKEHGKVKLAQTKVSQALSVSAGMGAINHFDQILRKSELQSDKIAVIQKAAEYPKEVLFKKSYLLTEEAQAAKSRYEAEQRAVGRFSFQIDPQVAAQYQKYNWSPKTEYTFLMSDVDSIQSKFRRSDFDVMSWQNKWFQGGLFWSLADSDPRLQLNGVKDSNGIADWMSKFASGINQLMGGTWSTILNNNSLFALFRSGMTELKDSYVSFRKMLTKEHDLIQQSWERYAERFIADSQTIPQFISMIASTDPTVLDNLTVAETHLVSELLTFNAIDLSWLPYLSAEDKRHILEARKLGLSSYVYMKPKGLFVSNNTCVADKANALSYRKFVASSDIPTIINIWNKTASNGLPGHRVMREALMQPKIQELPSGNELLNRILKIRLALGNTGEALVRLHEERCEYLNFNWSGEFELNPAIPSIVAELKSNYEMLREYKMNLLNNGVEFSKISRRDAESLYREYEQFAGSSDGKNLEYINTIFKPVSQFKYSYEDSKGVYPTLGGAIYSNTAEKYIAGLVCGEEPPVRDPNYRPADHWGRWTWHWMISKLKGEETPHVQMGAADGIMSYITAGWRLPTILPPRITVDKPSICGSNRTIMTLFDDPTTGKRTNALAYARRKIRPELDPTKNTIQKTSENLANYLEGFYRQVDWAMAFMMEKQAQLTRDKLWPVFINTELTEVKKFWAPESAERSGTFWGAFWDNVKSTWGGERSNKLADQDLLGYGEAAGLRRSILNESSQYLKMIALIMRPEYKREMVDESGKSSIETYKTRDYIDAIAQLLTVRPSQSRELLRQKKDYMIGAFRMQQDIPYPGEIKDANGNDIGVSDEKIWQDVEKMRADSAYVILVKQIFEDLESIYLFEHEERGFNDSVTTPKYSAFLEAKVALEKAIDQLLSYDRKLVFAAELLKENNSSVPSGMN